MNRSEPPPALSAVETFNLVAPGYDDPALRFFPFCADRVIARLKPAPGSKLLDIAAGTGACALAAAQVVGPRGRVAAIDLAPAMLDQLQAKIAHFGIGNIDLHIMDAAKLDFRRDYFDYAVCSFGLFFLSDMAAALREWVRVLKPGGRLLFTTFGKNAFQPMMDSLRARLTARGILPAGDGTPLAATRLADPGQCRELLAQAGMRQVEVTAEQFGYHLKDESQWWDVLRNSGARRWLEQIPSAQRAGFRAEHLAELRPLVSERGLWLDVETLVAEGVKP